MGLNIKNEEACRLASELARLTGTTKTGAITLALRERLERDSKRHGAGLAAHHAPQCRAVRCAGGSRASTGQHGAMLYDEQGLPK